MKKLATLALTGAITLSVAFGQSKLTENELLGTWKMVIELDEVMAELDKEAKESETLLAEVIINSVSGVIEGVLDNVNIYLDFERGGRATVMVDAFDEREDDEDTEWYIKNGRLYIDDAGHFESDGDDYWVLRDGVLFLEKDEDEKAKVYMVRVK